MNGVSVINFGPCSEKKVNHELCVIKLKKTRTLTPKKIMADGLIVDGADMCAICLDPLNDKDVSRLECGHAFHSMCLVPHLQKDPRCPCCRHVPSGHMYPEGVIEWFTDDETGDSGITMQDAIKNAKVSAKSNKRISKQIETLKKWQNERRTSTARMRQLAQQLGPLEDKVEDKIDAFADKMWTAFETRHKRLLTDLDETKHAVKRSRNNLWLAKVRVATKGGWSRY